MTRHHIPVMDAIHIPIQSGSENDAIKIRVSEGRISSEPRRITYLAEIFDSQNPDHTCILIGEIDTAARFRTDKRQEPLRFGGAIAEMPAQEHH